MELNYDCWHHLFTFLDKFDLARLRQICRSLNIKINKYMKQCIIKLSFRDIDQDYSINWMLDHCENLRVLDLHGRKRKIKDDSKSICGLRKLTNLYLENTSANDEIVFKIVTSCSNIQKLTLPYCEITEESIRCIALNLKSLTAINLNWNSIKESALCQLPRSCTDLQELHFSNTDIGDPFIQCVAQHLKFLTLLDVSGNDTITDNSMCNLIYSCSKLSVIDISGCDLITDLSVSSIAQNCPGLISLKCDECEHVTDASLHHIARNCLQLKVLSVKCCESISDETILSLPPSLIELHVVYGEQLSSEALYGVVAKSNNLRLLYISGYHLNAKLLGLLREKFENDLGFIFFCDGREGLYYF